MPETFKEKLNAEISTEEIYEVISASKTGKAPGPDRLTSRFFKVFKDQITPYLG